VHQPESRSHLGFLVRIVGHGDCYAVSAKAALDFVVYSCVSVSPAGVPKTRNLPIPKVSSYELGVAG